MSNKQDDEIEDSFDDLGDENLDDLDDSDTTESFDTNDLGDENWDEESAENAPRKKKKGGFTNLLIIGGGLLAAGAFVYIKFMSPPAGLPQNVAPTEQVASDSVPVEVPAAVPPAIAPDVQSAEAESQMAPVEAPPALTPMPDFTAPESVSPALPAEGAPVETGIVPVAPETATPSLAATPEFPPSPPVVSPSLPPEIVPPPAPTLVAEAPAVTEPETAPAATPVDEDRLKRIEDQLQALINKTETQAAPDNAGLQSLADALDGLAKRLDKLEAGSAQSSVRQVAKSVDNNVASPIPQKAVPKSAATAQPVAPRPAKKWTLRAVSDGVAYIAPRGTNALQSVRVGDTVDGLGRITAITQTDGRWKVSGTRGSASQ